MLGLSFEHWQVIGVIVSSVVSTSALVWAIIESNKNSKVINKIFREINRANISIYSEALIANRKYFYLIIRNFGKLPATIKEIKLDGITSKALEIDNKDFIRRLEGNQIAQGKSVTHLVLSQNIPADHKSLITIKYMSDDSEITYISEFAGSLDTAHKFPSIGQSDKPYEHQILELYQDHLRKRL